MSSGYFHVGIIVTDIDEAASDFARVLDIEFNDPTSMAVPVIRDGSRDAQLVRVAYSRTGPPYVELIEPTEPGYFQVDSGEGFHHLGLWLPEADDMTDPERFACLHVEAEIPHEATTGTVTRMTAPRSLHGIRLEMIEPADRANLEAWITGTTQTPR
jgi:hypothetical protein